MLIPASTLRAGSEKAILHPFCYAFKTRAWAEGSNTTEMSSHGDGNWDDSEEYLVDSQYLEVHHNLAVLAASDLDGSKPGLGKQLIPRLLSCVPNGSCSSCLCYVAVASWRFDEQWALAVCHTTET